MHPMPPLLVSVHKESFDIFFFCLFEIYNCCPEKMQVPHPCKVEASLDGGPDQHVEGVPGHGRGLELNDA